MTKSGSREAAEKWEASCAHSKVFFHKTKEPSNLFIQCWCHVKTLFNLLTQSAQFMALDLKEEKKETLCSCSRSLCTNQQTNQPREEKREREKNVFTASLAVIAQQEKQNLNMEKLNKLQRHVNRYEKFCNASNLKNSLAQ